MNIFEFVVFYYSIFFFYVIHLDFSFFHFCYQRIHIFFSFFWEKVRGKREKGLKLLLMSNGILDIEIHHVDFFVSKNLLISKIVWRCGFVKKTKCSDDFWFFCFGRFSNQYIFALSLVFRTLWNVFVRVINGGKSLHWTEKTILRLIFGYILQYSHVNDWSNIKTRHRLKDPSDLTLRYIGILSKVVTLNLVWPFQRFGQFSSNTVQSVWIIAPSWPLVKSGPFRPNIRIEFNITPRLDTIKRMICY